MTQSALTHYSNPLQIDKTWCGAEQEPRHQWDYRAPIGCVVCADLRDVFLRALSPLEQEIHDRHYQRSSA